MGLDEETHLGLPAFGPQSNQLPLDRKITLFFKYTKGTIEQIRVTNITNSSNIDLGTFQVPDKWNANEHRLHFNFSYEAFYNISVEVTNSEMNGAWVKVEKMFQIVGKVINVKIDDFKLVVGKEEPKMFEFKFESTGAGTCMIVDYKDGFKRAYGDEKYCAEWKPSITYDPAVEFISSPMILNHTYW
ncbi:uncharacterized protein LOC111704816 [Eurytemora carolleeae]|uniref:uncharacterized protein LOC111704816 n=1 Tax=Eurytemora carolleeae TaxID=1294199 RepID=UPI000C760CFD|nr:uncharacterized protein LOC111704816 [Eurytemora carolleeae]|eukprot:XP_023332935.1 uncharacterized protein LOC111704816 [Eurytemora affinis]